MFNNMQPAEIIVLVALALVVIVLSLLGRKRDRAIVSHWAADNGLTVVRVERRYFRKGPYFFVNGRTHDVLYVKVRDNTGLEKQAYLKLRKVFSASQESSLEANVEVKWVENI